ncbi:MAG: ZIP family metal transporter [Clostridia bacterium]|jgi:ZIP family zinc transporter|nr:ZIP family metal transporter [Clostridia bacterium]MDD4275436.1 ZIP family metal transporter [Clostridia bacterium]
METLKLVIYSGIAGIIGTGIGGLIGIFLGKKSIRTVSIILAFAGGIMISISVFDLIPESYMLGGTYITVFGVLVGILLISALNYWLDKITQKKDSKVRIHSTLESLYHEEEIINNKQNNTKLLKLGSIMLLAIALHNFPEGMAIGSSGSINTNLGLTLAILLALHNIPEGMAMSVPLIAGGLTRLKTIMLVLVAGAITILGGLFGAYIGNIGGNVTALAVSFAAGAMLYVTFCEIIPQSILMEKGKLSMLVLVLGILAGFTITNAL